jgi:hypothetical protein
MGLALLLETPVCDSLEELFQGIELSIDNNYSLLSMVTLLFQMTKPINIIVYGN